MKRVCNSVSLFLVVAVLRILCRGVWTSARFHSHPRGCLFGCREGRDDLSHYQHCPKVSGFFSSWARPLFPLGFAAPLPVLCCVDGRAPDTKRDVALCTLAECFVHTHSQFRLRLVSASTPPDAVFEGRLRMLMLRHPPIRAAIQHVRNPRG